ncbi:MAG: DUF1800 domain-containing protein [Planctomycetes bacterium]|nr:DUF1800 domain-containing protein [Planctomycetota bacterium]
MTLSRRGFLLATGGACAAFAGCDRLERGLGVRVPEGAFLAPSAGELDFAQHVLARCSFGPRPGDRAALLALDGDPHAAARAWLERQLAPASIDDEQSERAARRCDSIDAPLGELYEYKPAVLLRELTAAALLRATYSQRQLFEVLVEFWTDHFNIDSSKAECAWLEAGHDREVIRKHALGRFSELLQASAFSPAMLWYLDGRANVKRTPEERPNENFARELLELHTLGVHGGYTQTDVMEAARCLSGWTVRDRHGFKKAQVEFHSDAHDDGRKCVLGVEIPSGGGERDVQILLDALARHPATARHIATKLCTRFLADLPPAAAVADVAAAFEASAGDIPSTLRALFSRPEFEQLRGVKLKRPFHYLVSILRASAAQTDGGPALASYLARMGQAPFQYPTPDGYPEEASAWQGALFWRWKLGFALANGRVAGTRIDAARLVERAGGADALLAHLLGRTPRERERELFLDEGEPRLGLVFASPAFQRC